VLTFLAPVSIFLLSPIVLMGNSLFKRKPQPVMVLSGSGFHLEEVLRTNRPFLPTRQFQVDGISFVIGACHDSDRNKTWRVMCAPQGTKKKEVKGTSSLTSTRLHIYPYPKEKNLIKEDRNEYS
jgi:hypothetical protein